MADGSQLAQARPPAEDELVARAVAAGVPADLARIIVALAESNAARDYAARESNPPPHVQP